MNKGSPYDFTEARLFFMGLLLLSFAGVLFAGEKGGSTEENPVEAQILKRYEDFGQCIFVSEDEQQEAFINLCEKLSVDPYINSPMSHGISADNDFETRRNFYKNCCY